MGNAPRATLGDASSTSGGSLCFILDEDFVFRRELTKELRQNNIEVVEFSSSARFSDMIDEQNPDIVLINLNENSPQEFVRALLALKDCRYAGAVQLIGRCERRVLESFRTIGVDNSLNMLPPLQKPIKFATLQGIIRERKLGTTSPLPRGISLKDALAKNMVTFHYQPKLDLKTSMLVGAEAVARVVHPQIGLLTPDQFLKGADEEALLALSRLALVSAVRASEHFLGSGASMQIAINISVDNLLALPISELVLMHRPERADWPGLLLELPERQVVNKVDALKARVPRLRQSGVGLAIDNFGRASFTLSMLNQIPFSEIKIDRSLVENCAGDGGNAKMCKTVVQMAHNFACRAVAVGISAEADLHALSQLDCDMGQGFLLGKPMPMAQIDELIASFVQPAARLH